MATYTAGPWELARHGNEKLKVQGGPGKLIAVVYPMDGPCLMVGNDGTIKRHKGSMRQYPNENAALISAAPDLLAALEDAVNRLEHPSNWQTDDDRQGAWLLAHTLRAAIAKACGTGQ